MSSIDIDQDNVKSISDKCHQLNELQSQLKEKEEAISIIKNKVRDMEERIIPEMMQEAGCLLYTSPRTRDQRGYRIPSYG